MIVVNDKESVISGNTVLVPEYSPEANEYEKLKKSRNQNQNRLKIKRIKSKLKVLKNIAISFVVGLIIIGRYAVIYNMQKDLTNTNNQIITLAKENENLKVVIIKSTNMGEIEQQATTKFHMIQPTVKQAVYSDLTKENFPESTNIKSENSKTKEILSKIKNMLF